jgi:hypothetical protein
MWNVIHTGFAPCCCQAQQAALAHPLAVPAARAAPRGRRLGRPGSGGLLGLQCLSDGCPRRLHTGMWHSEAKLEG